MVEILQEPHLIKTRKEHICQGCGKQLPKGTECYSSSYADRTDVWTIYECFNCHGYFVEHCKSCNDFEYCIGENYSIGTIAECAIERRVKR